MAAVAVLTILAETGRLSAPHFVTTFEVIALGLFLAAGVLRVARWRVHGDRADALLGSALVVLGFGLLPLLRSGAYHDLGTAVVTVAAVGLLTRALLASTTAPTTAVLVLGSLTILGLAVHGQTGAPGVHAATAVAWGLLALLAWRRRRPCPWAGRATLPLGGMGAADALHVWVLLPATLGDGLVVTAALVTAAVACTAMHQAMADLEVTVGADQAVLETELRAASAAVAQRDAWLEDIGHEATNALAGLRSALSTLQRYAADLDAATVTGLQRAALAEVGHVEHLLDRRDADPRTEFDVAEVVRSVATTRRTTGTRVRLARVEGVAVGRPHDLTTALHNLLINVARHAPGARTVVDVEHRPGMLEVHVVDDGPGMSAELAQRVFERGVHGGHHLSSGLGLYLSRQLMREQGGDLELRGHTAGCHFVVTLPAADAVREAPLARVAVEVQALLGTTR